MVLRRTRGEFGSVVGVIGVTRGFGVIGQLGGRVAACSTDSTSDATSSYSPVVGPRLHGGHEEGDHDDDHAAGGLPRLDVPTHVAGHLLGPDELGHGLAQLLERRDVEQSHGEVRLEPAQDPARQRVRIDVRHEGAHDDPAPLIGVLVDHDERNGVVDQPGDVLVDRSDEQRLFVGEVRVRRRRGEPRIAADVGDRRAAIALTGEADDRRTRGGTGGCDRPSSPRSGWSDCSGRAALGQAAAAGAMSRPARSTPQATCQPFGHPAATEDSRLDERGQQRAQRPVAHGRASGGTVHDAPRGPGREADGAVDAGVDDRVEHRDGDAGAEVAHQGALDRAGGGPLLGEEEAAEGEVPGLLLAVVLRDRLDHRVGVGVLTGQLLQEVGDFFAAEDEQAEQRRHAGEDRHDARCSAMRPMVLSSGFLAFGFTWLEEPHEEAGVAGLLPHLVQQVRHPGVGEVGAGEDVEAESSHQDRLEADAGVHDGCELLSGQGALLLVGELVPELRDVGQGERARRGGPGRPRWRRERPCRAPRCA